MKSLIIGTYSDRSGTGSVERISGLYPLNVLSTFSPVEGSRITSTEPPPTLLHGMKSALLATLLILKYALIASIVGSFGPLMSLSSKYDLVP